MEKLIDYFGSPYSYYNGEHGDWIMLYTTTRDSSLLDMSNLEYIKKEFGYPNKDICIERASCSLVGYRDYFIVNPENTEFVKKAENILKRLEDYPVLSDDLYSNMEFEEYLEWLDIAERELSAEYDGIPELLEKYSDEIHELSYDNEGYITKWEIEEFLKDQGEI